MHRFLRFSAIVALHFSAPLVQTASAQNIGTARVNGPPQINSGTVEGNVHQMTGANVTLNGASVVTGDLLVPGTPTLVLNGAPVFGGVIVGSGSASPSNYQVILNGSPRLGHLRTRTNPIAIPALPPVPTPTGTRNVTITAPGQSVGNFATLRNLTLNGNVGQYAIPAGTYGDFTANADGGFTLGVAGAQQPAVYNLQRLTLNGATNIIVLGPVVINVANGFTANGTAGTSSNPAWLKLNIRTGAFTVNGGCTVHGYATVPSGRITINGAGKLIGGATCKDLTVNANGLLRLFDAASFENQPPVVAITSPAAGAVFNAGTPITLVASASDAGGSVAKVEFFAGATKLGEATSSPWTYLWQNAVVGSYQLTAIATDNLGATTTSSTVAIRVNAPPTAALTAPASQSVFQPGSAIPISANAADSDGTIQKVEFFADGVKLGEKAAAPYTFSWTNALTGPHALTARATDNDGAQTVSATVNIRVNAAPSVTMTAPANGTVAQAGSAIPLAANASDSDGTIAKVEFYAGATKVGEATTPPYQFNWNNAPAGPHSLTAKATDNDGAHTTSAPVDLTVNAPPAVGITSPAAAQVFNAADTIAITANASDPDGTVLKVEFFAGSNKIGESSAAPWAISWPAPAPGPYQLSAVATDDRGAQTTSSSVPITVNAPPTVAISSPSDQAVMQPGNPIALTANTSDSDGTISKVEFFAGAIKIGESSSTPFTFSWENAASGSYTITARATDNGTASAVSAPIHLRVNALPAISLTNPAQGATFNTGDAIVLSASATDPDDGITKVEFFAGGAKIGEAIASLYSITWSGAPEGTNILTARAEDGSGASATSVPVTINVTTTNTELTVDAGPDRLISLPGAATLEGQVLLNGGPAGPEVTLEWSLQSGPGAVTFSAPNATATSAAFTQPGNYVIRLTASNVDGANFDTAAVTVLAAPQAGPDSPISNRGREFWMAFLSGLPPPWEPDHAGAFLIISSEVATTGTVEIFKTYGIPGSWTSYREVVTFVVEAGQKTLVEVDGFFPQRYDGQYDLALPTAVHVVADAPVSVHALHSDDQTTDGSLILPNGMLGRDYFIMSYNNSLSFYPGSQTVFGGTQLAVVATQNETQVTITPTASTVAHPAGQPFTVTLQRGDVYRMINKTDVAGDFTGTRVQSDKPVAVYGGHVCATVPGSTAACDHLYEQMTPVDFWGRHFVTLPLATRQNGDRFRMLAANDNTRVSINGQIVAILDRGQFHETVLTGPASILADQRILLAQFAQSSAVDNTTGDPFMALIPPYEEFGRHYILSTQALHSYWYGGDRDIFDSYLGVIVDSAHTGSVTINGQPIASGQFVPIGDSGFSGATIPVAKDSTFDISSPTPIGTWIYGWAAYESYGFTGGLYAELDAGAADFGLTQSASAAPIGTTHRVRAHFNNAASLPVPSARVDFVVTGANPTTGFGYTAADGALEFSWVGAQAGADTVTATAGAFTATASVTWVSNSSNQPPHVNAGPDRVVALGQPLTLQGLVQDDGLPAGGQLVLQWSVLPGPGDVTFSDPASPTTTATFVYPGQYHLRLTAYDGQFAGDDELAVNVDIPPEFTSLEPSGSQVDQGKAWSVVVNARDLDGTIVSVELLEGAQVLARHEQNDNQVYYLTLSTVLTTLGQHSITVRLTDDLGATTDRVFEVTVRPAPIVQILTPAESVILAAGESVTFTASASSAGGAITRVVYEDVTDSYPWELGDGTGSNYQFTWTPTFAGTRLIAATAYDSNGASGTSAPVTITIESAGDPTVIITAPENGSSIYRRETVTFHVAASANAPAEISEVSFFDGTRYLDTKYSPPFEVQWFGNPLGSHTLRAEVWDTFGGYETASITVNVIPVPDLNVTLVQPQPNIPVKVNSPTTLAASIENVIGELYAVDFYVNGEWIGAGSSSSVIWTPNAIGEYEVEVYAQSSNPNQEGYAYTTITVADLHSPVVEFTAPANNSSFAPNTPIVLHAQASDIDSNLANLLLLADGQLLSEIPLSGGVGATSFTWENAGPGWHGLTARAVDDTVQIGNAFLRVFVQRPIRNDILPPSALTTAPASNEVVLNWTLPAPTGAVGTVIERKLGRYGVWEEIGTADAGVATHTDREVDSETYYGYRVASLTEEGAISTYSNEAVGITRVAQSTYAVIDLGEALEQGNAPGRPWHQARTLNHPQTIDLGAAIAKSISDTGAVLLQGVDANGQEIKGNYSVWRPNESTLTHSDEKLKLERITKDGTVVGTLDKTRLHGDLEVSETHGVFWPKDTFGTTDTMVDLTPSPEAYTVPTVATQAGWVEPDWLLTHSDTMGRFWWTPADPAVSFKGGREILWRARATDRNRLGDLVGEATIVYQARPWLEWRNLAQTDPFAAEHSVPITDAGSAIRWPAQPQPNSRGWEYLVNNVTNFGVATAFAVNDAGVSVGGIGFNHMLPEYFARFEDNLERTHAMRSTGEDEGQDFADLGTLGDGRYSYGWDINTAGVTVGYSTVTKADEIWRTQGVVWETGTTTATMLPHLGGTNTTYQNGYGYAHAINDQGRVVGQSLAPNTGPDAGQIPAISVAALWTKNAARDPSAPGAQSPHWEALDLNTRIASTTETLSSGETVTYRPWHLNAARGVNKGGWIVGTGLHYRYDAATNTLIPKPRSFLLVPVQLVDTKNKVLDDGDDVSIEPKATVEEKKDKSIAWIEPHDSEDILDAPDMPQLALRFPATETMGLKLKWKLQIKYSRPRGDQPDDARIKEQDEVYIPKKTAGQTDQPWREEALDGVIEIFHDSDWTAELQEKGLFGGEAELKYQLHKADGTVLGSEEKTLFSIGGKKPDATKAKTYIDAQAAAVDSRLVRLSYAAAKHESKDYNGQGSRYNQFWEDHGRRFRVDHRKGDPLWCKASYEESAGGFGLFQITGDATHGKYYNSPRKVLWNWQENVLAYLGISKIEGIGKAVANDPTKNGMQMRFFGFVQQLYPAAYQAPPINYSYEGVTLDAWEMGVVTLYNGAAGCPFTSVKLANGKEKKKQNPWKFFPTDSSGNRWRYNRNSNNYLHEVIQQR